MSAFRYDRFPNEILFYVDDQRVHAKREIYGKNDQGCARPSAIVITCNFTGAYHFRYFPTVKGEWTGTTLIVFAVYFALCVYPLIINVKEDLVWKSIVSKT